MGRIFKVTRERVRQIEAKAIRKLQHPIRSRKLGGVGLGVGFWDFVGIWDLARWVFRLRGAAPRRRFGLPRGAGFVSWGDFESRAQNPRMPPLRKAESLIPLQELDLQIHRLKVQRAEKPRLLASHEEKLSRCRASLEAVQGEIKALKLEGMKREHSVREFDDKISKIQAQSLQARKNDEYQAFMKEISGFKADKSRVEDGLLDVYMQVDEKLKLDKVRQEDCLQAEAEHAEARRRIEAEIAALDREIEEVLGRRSALTAAVEKEILKSYERVLEAKDDGAALAAVGKYEVIEDDGKATYWQCEGCSVGLTAQDVNLLLLGKDVQICRNCSRILYLRPA